jgi:hypothetical protein
VCSSVEKHAAEQRAEQEQAQALEQAQQSRQLVFEGLANDHYHLMGVYKLMEGKVVNGRAVWQKQGGSSSKGGKGDGKGVMTAVKGGGKGKGQGKGQGKGKGKGKRGAAIKSRPGESGTKELFLYYHRDYNIINKWCVSTRERMEKGKNIGYMFLATAALTPDRARPSEMCQVSDGRKFVEAAEARFVISQN